MKPAFASRALVMSGVIKDYTPGALIYKDDRLQLLTAAGELFNTPLSGVQKVKWPWMQFGWGCSIWVNNNKYAITFAKQAGFTDYEYGFDTVTNSNYTSSSAEVKNLLEQSASDGPKTIGKKWKEIFAGIS